MRALFVQAAVVSVGMIVGAGAAAPPQSAPIATLLDRSLRRVCSMPRP
jgi:hypothetical protein